MATKPLSNPLPVPDAPVGEVVTSVPSGAGTQSLAIAGFVTTALGYLPVVLALIPAFYYLILIYESKTVQDWVARRRARKAAKKLAKAKATAIVAAAQGEAKTVVADAAVAVAKDEIKSTQPPA